jgi:hypothetical protein
MVPDLIATVETVVRALPFRSPEADRIFIRFERVTPAERCRTVADILNAAWRASLDQRFWAILPVISTRREVVLKELTLKNLGIFEIEQIQRGSRAP